MTWATHITKAQTRGKLRLAIMIKLTITSWGADEKVLKRVYTERVRPVLEYGISAWSTATKTNFEKVQNIQNQAARIITGALRSTPINRIESITGLQYMEDRRPAEFFNNPKSLSG
jgi:hypothetical protein